MILDGIIRLLCDFGQDLCKIGLDVYGCVVMSVRVCVMLDGMLCLCCDPG